jgi:hypothetical protein
MQAVEKAALKAALSEASNEEFLQWLNWAKAHADLLNPILDSLPFESEPDS